MKQQIAEIKKQLSKVGKLIEQLGEPLPSGVVDLEYQIGEVPSCENGGLEIRGQIQGTLKITGDALKISGDMTGLSVEYMPTGAIPKVFDRLEGQS